MHWSPLPVGWPKLNMDESRLESKHSSIISVICGDKIGWVCYINEKAIGDYPTLVLDTIAFREAILATIRNGYPISSSKVILR